MSVRFGRLVKPIGRETLTIDGTVRALSFPPTAYGAIVRFHDGPVRVTVDGTTPSASVGKVGYDLDERLFTRYELAGFRAIRDGGTNGTADVDYYELA